MGSRARALWVVAALWGAAACLRVDLAGHACPCVDGYTCVEDVCVDDDELPDCTADGCPSPLICVDGGCVAQAQCPASFDSGDACTDHPPSATLRAVCDPGGLYPADAVDEVGFSAMGSCPTTGATIALQSSDLAGSIAPAGEDSYTLALEGTLTYQIDLPAACINEFLGCEPSEGTGTCGDAGGGACRCTDVRVDVATENIEQVGDVFFGADASYFGCTVEGRYLLRRDDGAGRLGPILVFQ